MRVVATAFKLSRGSDSSAGYDLRAAESGLVSPQSRAVIKTGLYLEIPPGHYGRIAPRSGLAVKSGLNVLAGVIDCDYRGEVRVVVHNTDQFHFFSYERGDRIAQLIIEACHHPDIEYVDVLDDTVRGEDGFGSTGK